MKLHTEVEQVYIDAGVRRDCNRCPVALALLGQHAITAKVAYDRALLSMANGDKLVRWNDPDMSSRIQKYDETGVMEPFSFDVEVPE